MNEDKLVNVSSDLRVFKSLLHETDFQYLLIPVKKKNKEANFKHVLAN